MNKTGIDRQESATRSPSKATLAAPWEPMILILSCAAKTGNMCHMAAGWLLDTGMLNVSCVDPAVDIWKQKPKRGSKQTAEST